MSSNNRDGMLWGGKRQKLNAVMCKSLVRFPRKREKQFEHVCNIYHKIIEGSHPATAAAATSTTTSTTAKRGREKKTEWRREEQIQNIRKQIQRYTHITSGTNSNEIRKKKIIRAMHDERRTLRAHHELEKKDEKHRIEARWKWKNNDSLFFPSIFFLWGKRTAFH